MSYFDLPTKTVNIDDENSFTIRKMTYGERQSILEQVLKVKGDMSGEGSFDMDVSEMKIKTLETCLVSWDGPGFDNRLVNLKNILELPNWVAEKMVEEIDSFNSSLSESEKND